MIRALWALMKMGAIIALVLWVAERPGTVTLDWMDYKLTVHVGFFLLVLLGIIVLSILVFSLLKTFSDLPKTMARYRDTTHKDKGLKALTLGLTAVAAGDAKVACDQAERAQRFLKSGEALPKLLAAQAARLEGRDVDASLAFVSLLEDKNAAFLGVRGLLQAALDSGDDAGALVIAHRALALHPKQGWILQIVYDLEIKARCWTRALKILDRAEKAGGMEAEKAKSDRVAILLAQADQAALDGEAALHLRLLKKAYALDSRFIPTVVRLARCYLAKNKRKAALSLIEKTWKSAPHSDLVALWREAYAPPRKNDPIVQVRWFEKLLRFDPQSVEGLQALANVLIQEGLWGEARKHLEQAETIAPSAALYRLRARLEERATHDDAAVRVWLEKAADAPQACAWICTETGRVYEAWMPLSDQGLFNTMRWDMSQSFGMATKMLGATFLSDALLKI